MISLCFFILYKYELCSQVMSFCSQVSSLWTVCSTVSSRFNRSIRAANVVSIIKKFISAIIVSAALFFTGTTSWWSAWEVNRYNITARFLPWSDFIGTGSFVSCCRDNRRRCLVEDFPRAAVRSDYNVAGVLEAVLRIVNRCMNRESPSYRWQVRTCDVQVLSRTEISLKTLLRKFYKIE